MCVFGGSYALPFCRGETSAPITASQARVVLSTCVCTCVCVTCVSLCGSPRSTYICYTHATPIDLALEVAVQEVRRRPRDELVQGHLREVSHDVHGVITVIITGLITG